jgi:O-antigen/teichoic acid export membrane protein
VQCLIYAKNYDTILTCVEEITVHVRTRRRQAQGKHIEKNRSLDESLQKITRGAGIALLGTFLGLLLQFVTRIILARYGTQAEYGTYSLALTVINPLTVIAGVGLYEGTARYIAYLRAKRLFQSIPNVARDAILLPLISSLIVGLALFALADVLAISVFHSELLSLPFRVLSVGLPLITLINSIIAIYRGYDRVGPQVLFQSVIISGLFLVLSLGIIFFKLPFEMVFYSYVFSIAATLVALLVYSARFKQMPGEHDGLVSGGSLRKDLLVFSLPIMGTALLYTLMTSTDTLTLGYFKPVDDVGIYNAGYTLASMLTVFLAAFQLIFVPISTGLYSNNLLHELKRNYIIVTKWLTSITFPLFLVFFLFPDAVLNLIFGDNYLGGSIILRVLSMGCILGNLLGLSSGILIAIGKPKYNMYATALAVLTNIILGITLIPRLGILGAAIASAVSISLLNVFCATVVYNNIRALPISWNLLKPMVSSLLLALAFQLIIKYFFTLSSSWILLAVFALYYFLYMLSIFVTRSFDQEDIQLIVKIAGLFGIEEDRLVKFAKNMRLK